MPRPNGKSFKGRKPKPGGQNKKKGKGKGKTKKSDKRHAQEFGELHPVNDVDDSFRSHAPTKRARWDDEVAPKVQPVQHPAESDDSDDETPAMRQLLGMIGPDVPDSDEDDDDELMEQEQSEDDAEGETIDLTGLTEEEARAKLAALGEAFEIVAEDDLALEGKEEDEDEDSDGESAVLAGKGLEASSDDDEGDDDAEDDEDDDEDDEEEELAAAKASKRGEDQQFFKVLRNKDDDEGDELEEYTSSGYGDAFEEHFEPPELEDEVPLSFLNMLKQPLGKPSSSKSKKHVLGSKTVLQGAVTRAERARTFHPRMRVDAAVRAMQEGATELAQLPKARALVDELAAYRDIVVNGTSLQDMPQLRLGYMLHVMHHVLYNRTRIIDHAAKLKTADSDDVEFRDQGFTRPKALILVPYRHVAMALVSILRDLMVDPDNVKKTHLRHAKKFTREYGAEGEVYDHPNEEYRTLFGGNCDDCFLLGLAIKNHNINMYNDLYTSDVIIASPLGLRRIIGGEGDKNRDFDYLSGIEVCVVDSADIYLMQNFSHVEHVFDHMNKLPTDPRDADIGRIRHWALQELSARFRQTLVLSRVAAPSITRLVRMHCNNYAGQVRFSDAPEGSIQRTITNVCQMYHAIRPASAVDDADARFKFFTETVLPNIEKSKLTHVLVFIPSYFDFVRVRNHLREQESDFAQICEYTERPNVSRARSAFFHGTRPVLLYTERFHFHNRPSLRNIKHVVFYQLPTYADFYPELLNRITQPEGASCSVLYSRYDAMQLAAVIGAKRSKKLLASSKDSHMFV